MNARMDTAMMTVKCFDKGDCHSGLWGQRPETLGRGDHIQTFPAPLALGKNAYLKDAIGSPDKAEVDIRISKAKGDVHKRCCHQATCT